MFPKVHGLIFTLRPPVADILGKRHMRRRPEMADREDPCVPLTWSQFEKVRELVGEGSNLEQLQWLDIYIH